MLFEEVTYNIGLHGKFKLLLLQQTLENHSAISGGWLKDQFGAHGLLAYELETEIGITEVNVFAFDSPNEADQILLKVPIATPLAFMNTVIELIADLARLFTFSIQAYEIRMLTGYKFGSWYEVEDYIRLNHDYQEVHQLWRGATGMPACKTSESLFARTCILAQAKQRQQPITIILCPHDGEIGFGQLGGYPSFGVIGTPINRKKFYRQLEAIHLQQGRLLGIRRKTKIIPPSPNSLVPEQQISIEVIHLDVDKVELELELHFRTEEQVSWVDCQIASGMAASVVEKLLQCLVELATKLNLAVIEGLDFQKSIPSNLDTQKLVDFLSA